MGRGLTSHREIERTKVMAAASLADGRRHRSPPTLLPAKSKFPRDTSLKYADSPLKRKEFW